MDDMARGWAIFREHAHGHSWAVWIAIFTAICIPIGFGWQQKKNQKPDVEDFRPKPRTRIQGTETRIPGSEKDYRR